MAFTLETGTGIAGANAYVDVAYVDTHHLDRGNSAWDDFTTVEKQQSIIRGTEYIDKRFGIKFRGVRVSKEQGLEWPRLSAFDADGFLLSGVDDLPRQLEKAAAEYALRAAICGTLAPDPPLPVPKQDLTDSTGTRPDQAETGQLLPGTDRRLRCIREQPDWRQRSAAARTENRGLRRRREESPQRRHEVWVRLHMFALMGSARRSERRIRREGEVQRRTVRSHLRGREVHNRVVGPLTGRTMRGTGG